MTGGESRKFTDKRVPNPNADCAEGELTSCTAARAFPRPAISRTGGSARAVPRPHPTSPLQAPPPGGGGRDPAHPTLRHSHTHTPQLPRGEPLAFQPFGCSSRKRLRPGTFPGVGDWGRLDSRAQSPGAPGEGPPQRPPSQSALAPSPLARSSASALRGWGPEAGWAEGSPALWACGSPAAAGRSLPTAPPPPPPGCTLPEPGRRGVCGTRRANTRNK